MADDKALNDAVKRGDVDAVNLIVAKLVQEADEKGATQRRPSFEMYCKEGGLMRLIEPSAVERCALFEDAVKCGDVDAVNLMVAELVQKADKTVPPRRSHPLRCTARRVV
jgi:hypothetical protein